MFINGWNRACNQFEFPRNVFHSYSKCVDSHQYILQQKCLQHELQFHPSKNWFFVQILTVWRKKLNFLADENILALLLNLHKYFNNCRARCLISRQWFFSLKNFYFSIGIKPFEIKLQHSINIYPTHLWRELIMV